MWISGRKCIGKEWLRKLEQKEKDVGELLEQGTKVCLVLS